MITKQSFDLMVELFIRDRALVNAMIDIFSFFDYTVFSGVLKDGYDHYTTIDQETRDQFDALFNVVLGALS